MGEKPHGYQPPERIRPLEETTPTDPVEAAPHVPPVPRAEKPLVQGPIEATEAVQELIGDPDFDNHALDWFLTRNVPPPLVLYEDSASVTADKVRVRYQEALSEHLAQNDEPDVKPPSRLRRMISLITNRGYASEDFYKE